MNPLALAGLALDGLRRKIGRNLLTMGGVFIGVLALTLIVSLGQGMTRAVEATVASGENLRQIGLSPGFGARVGDEGEIRIEGEMSENRRRRLRRAALVRTRPGHSFGRRVETFDREALARIAEIPHVQSVTPIVSERYRISALGHETEATPTMGLDVGRRRLADRVIAGRYLASPTGDEVLVHEYLAYRWGYVTEAQLEDVIGKPVTLEALGNERGAFAPSPEMIAEVLGGLDLSTLTDEERAALPRIVEKLTQAPAPAPGKPLTRTMTIVGVVRELEPGDPFSVVEDGNAFQVDVFLPSETAIEMYLASPVNRELGFRRALVLVDDARNAKTVETELRDRGHTAFSVATVLDRIERSLGILTLVVAFLTGIALVVAALGIVNTMVTSVIERTSEIGLWKAVGATDGQVRAVFVLEAAMIGLLGGCLGLGAALLLSLPGDAIAERILAREAAVPLEGSLFRIPAWLALGGPALATAVAVLASLYPAARAARVDPVKALRHD